MNPERMKAGIPTKSAKIVDVDNLLSKHFGSEWREMKRLDFLKLVIGERTKFKPEAVSEYEDDEETCDHEACEYGHDEDDEYV